jgi:phenylalanyl-tRNA synthetase alpha chain
MTELKNIIESLHPLEIKVLKHLKNNATASEIAKQANLQYVEAMKALQFLEAKDAIKLNLQKQEIIELDKNGLIYQKQGLPEKIFLNALLDGPLSLQDLQKKSNLDKNEISISLGLLKKQGFISITKEISLTSPGKEYLNKETPEEKLLSQLPLDSKVLIDEQKQTLKLLQKRKEIIKINSKNIYTVSLNELATKLMNTKIDTNLIDSLTIDLLKTGEWKSKKFRRYDVTASIGQSFTPKRHIVPQALNYVKRLWLDMGFKEMNGNMIESSFWNFDALFTPQDHPGRELQDTFFIDEKSKLPNKEIVSKVKNAHEFNWKYNWDEQIAKETVLRTHTTAITAHKLASLKETDLPAKFFSVGKCFRNEALDWTHAFEFNQTEGIVIDPNANFKHLLGYLKNFAKKMGFPKVRFRPAYFPYTEPSLEGDYYDPKRKKWVEFIAAGMLRPEVVIPLLGKDIPVLAWGPGIDRMITSAYKLTDIRQLYKNDLKELRQAKIWLK